jgi:glycosyltransferase involved in cell wall biosynthesis
MAELPKGVFVLSDIMLRKGSIMFDSRTELQYGVADAPLVSVVMSVRNGEAFLATAIQSILDQSLRSFELIIVDDGSVDGGPEIINHYAKHDDRIVILRQRQAGLVIALNRGCRRAQGSLIARIDSDDEAMPQRLEVQAQYLHEHPDVALLGGRTECVDEYGKTQFLMHWPTQDEGLSDHMLIDCCMAHTTVMFRREVFWTLGGYRSQFLHAEDYDLFLRFADNHGIENVSQVLCKYRLHPDQVSILNWRQQIVTGIGARLAARCRRANREEPAWSEYVTTEDLIKLGVPQSRVDKLMSGYDPLTHTLANGWRWAGSPFCFPVSP